MILGFLMGWAAATMYWAWVESLYAKPLPPPSGAVRLEDNGRRTLTRWKADRGP